MLQTILRTQMEQLQRLGKVWQGRGAAALGLYVAGELAWQWPAAATNTPPTLTAPINGPVALGVTGSSSLFDQERLEADAQFLRHAAALETDLELMTGELIETQDQLLTLYDLTRTARSYLDVPDALQAVVQEVARLVKVENAFAIMQAPPEWPHLLICHPECMVDEAELVHHFQRMQSQGEEMLCQGQDAAAKLPPHIRNLLLVPVMVRGQILVGLGFINRLLGDEFHSPDIKLIRAIAEQVGVQIENALLLHETLHQARLQTEMDLARQVQLQLLPQNPPPVVGLDLYARSVPALQVGGDFYDFVCEPNGTLIFTVGDVSGKGVSSALVMAMIRTIMRSASKFEAHPSPQRLLDRANRDLYDDFTDLAMFATVFVGQYDVRNQCLTYANAGHSPVIYCPAGGKACLLEADGTAVGILPDNLAMDQKLSFGPGDLLVAATDGFSEAQAGDGELFGYDRLLRLVEQHCHQSAQQVAEALYAAITQFASGHPQDDDQTLIVVKGKG